MLASTSQEDDREGKPGTGDFQGRCRMCMEEYRYRYLCIIHGCLLRCPINNLLVFLDIPFFFVSFLYQLEYKDVLLI